MASPPPSLVVHAPATAPADCASLVDAILLLASGDPIVARDGAECDVRGDMDALRCAWRLAFVRDVAPLRALPPALLDASAAPSAAALYHNAFTRPQKARLARGAWTPPSDSVLLGTLTIDVTRHVARPAAILASAERGLCVWVGSAPLGAMEAELSFGDPAPTLFETRWFGDTAAARARSRHHVSNAVRASPVCDFPEWVVRNDAHAVRGELPFLRLRVARSTDEWEAEARTEVALSQLVRAAASPQIARDLCDAAAERGWTSVFQRAAIAHVDTGAAATTKRVDARTSVLALLARAAARCASQSDMDDVEMIQTLATIEKATVRRPPATRVARALATTDPRLTPLATVVRDSRTLYTFVQVPSRDNCRKEALQKRLALALAGLEHACGLYEDARATCLLHDPTCDDVLEAYARIGDATQLVALVHCDEDGLVSSCSVASKAFRDTLNTDADGVVRLLMWPCATIFVVTKIPADGLRCMCSDKIRRETLRIAPWLSTTTMSAELPRSPRSDRRRPRVSVFDDLRRAIRAKNVNKVD